MTSAATESLHTTRRRLWLFPLTLGVGWIALAIVAAEYARLKHIPARVAWPLALAFLTEFSFYLVPGFAEVRAWLATHLTRLHLAMSIAVSGIVPYILFALPTGDFHLPRAAILAGFIVACAFWFVPRIEGRAIGALRDLGFVALVAAVILSGIFRWIFPDPIPKLHMEVLGHLALIHCAVLAVILLRPADPAGYGFVPKWRDLAIGGFWFLVCAVVATPLGIRLGAIRVAGHFPTIWQAAATLVGMFYFVSLSEEFFFRGLLQRWLSKWARSKFAGLITASLLFGACHLSFHGMFPNWKFAILATILGFCTGVAFSQARSIQASMVTHALAASALRLFLS